MSRAGVRPNDLDGILYLSPAHTKNGVRSYMTRRWRVLTRPVHELEALAALVPALSALRVATHLVTRPQRGSDSRQRPAGTSIHSFCSAQAPPVARPLLGSVDPWTMAGLLNPGAGLGPVVILTSQSALRLPALEAPLRRADVPRLALVVLAAASLARPLQMFGLARKDRGVEVQWRAPFVGAPQVKCNGAANWTSAVVPEGGATRRDRPP